MYTVMWMCLQTFDTDSINKKKKIGRQTHDSDIIAAAYHRFCVGHIPCFD